MSDDTPTERFPASEPSGTSPLPSAQPPAQGSTEPLSAPPAEAAPTELLFSPTAASVPPPPPRATYGATEEKPSRAVLYTLIAVGAALLIAVVIVVVLLLNRDDDQPAPVPSGSSSPSVSASPSPSASPSESPSAEPAPEPEPPAEVGPTFDGFDAQPTAGCADGDTAKPITFSWSSSNATTAYIGVATTNAKSEPYESGLPPVDTFTLDYQCSLATQVYTVTLEDADGNLAHQTVTITK